MTIIDTTVFLDPGCPWAYSTNPALRAIEWRYGDQLRQRLVLIGLAEEREQYLDKGFTARLFATLQVGFRRFGMPFAPNAKADIAATSPACRAIAAARIDDPGSEWAVLRTLQFAQFTTDVMLDDVEDLRLVLSDVDGVDRSALVDRIEDEDVRAAYEADRAEARSADGTPGALLGKLAKDGAVDRYTAPSLIFRHDGRQLDAAGFVPVEVYDAMIANLDPTLERRAPAETAADALADFSNGLTTQEVAAVMVKGNDAIDRDGVERELVQLVADGGATRVQLGDDALWRTVA